MNLPASKKNYTTKNTTSDVAELRDKAQSYSNSNNLGKLDIVNYLYKSVQAKEDMIQQLHGKLSNDQMTIQKMSAQKRTDQKFVEIIKKTKQEYAKQIEMIRSQNTRLNQEVRKLKKQLSSANTNTQKQLVYENFSSFEIKIDGQMEIQDLKSRIRIKQAQNQKILSEWEKEKKQYSKFNEKYFRQIKEYKQTRQSQRKNDLTLSAELTKLKETQSRLLQEKKQIQSKLTLQQQDKLLIFKSFKQVLVTTSILVDSSKFSGYLNALTIQDFKKNDKKTKLIDFIKQNNNNINNLISDFKSTKNVLEEKSKLCGQQQEEKKKITAQLLDKANQLKNEVEIKGDVIKKNQSLSQTVKIKEKQIDQLNFSLSKKQEEKLLLQDQIEGLTKTVRKNQATITSQLSEITKFKAEIKEFQIRVNILNNKKAELDLKVSQSDKKISNLTIKIGQLDQQINQLDDQIIQLKKWLQQKQGNIRLLELSLKDQIQAKLTLQDKLDKANDQLNIKKRENENLNISQKQSKQTIRELNSILHEINQKLIGQTSHCFLGKTLSIQPGSFTSLRRFKEESDNLLKLWKESKKSLQFFNGSQVVTKDGIDFILSTLEDYVRCTPVETRLIYKYDPLNPTNFHSYLDRNENLISFIKLSNGTVIGGFTVYPIEQKNTMKPGKGFLFNMTNKKSYHLRNEPKLPVVSFDRYYYLFGNAEIRLRSQEKKVFSNFGIASSTFDNANDSRTKFLGTSETSSNEQEIQTYEFYQIIFE